MSAFPVADYAYCADEAFSAISELANANLESYSTDVQLTRDRTIRRLEQALSTASRWGARPGTEEAIAAYVELTRAGELTEVLWYSLRASTPEHRASLDLSRFITKMRLLLCEHAPAAGEIDEVVHRVASEALC